MSKLSVIALGLALAFTSSAFADDVTDPDLCVSIAGGGACMATDGNKCKMAKAGTPCKADPAAANAAAAAPSVAPAATPAKQ